MRISIVLGCVLASTIAYADDDCHPNDNGLYSTIAEAQRCERLADANKLAPYNRWRWEVAVGGSFGALRLRQQDLDPGGLLVQAGVRDHRFALVADYRALGVTWHADPIASQIDPSWVSTDQGGSLRRYGIAARLNVLTLGLDAIDKNMTFAHEFCELFLEVGVGREQIEWDQGGEVSRTDVEYGGGARLYGMRISDHRTIGVLFRIAQFASRRPDSYDTSPTCSGPCDKPTAPTAWDKGILVGIALVVSS